MLLHCPNCNITLECKQHGSYLIGGDPFSVRYSISECPKCRNPLLTKESEQFDFDTFEWGTPILIYPNNDFHINPSIPEVLRTSLLESILCLKAGAYSSTVIMCRRTLEGFSQIHGIKKPNLEQSIKDLNHKGIINDQLYEWANELRLSGNKAVHDIYATFSSIDAKDILDFTIAILDFTYSYKEKFDQFKRRQLLTSGNRES